jgi:hypothetical protein
MMVAIERLHCNPRMTPPLPFRPNPSTVQPSSHTACPDDPRRPESIQFGQKPPIHLRRSTLAITNRHMTSLKSDRPVAAQLLHAEIIGQEGLNSKLNSLMIG